MSKRHHILGKSRSGSSNNRTLARIRNSEKIHKGRDRFGSKRSLKKDGGEEKKDAK